jgi:hypothetical protein
MPKTRLSAILYLLLVFGSGILVGVASNRLYAVKASVAPASAAPRTLAEFRARYMSDMRTKIPDVTDDQVTAVSKILDDTKKKFDDLRREERPTRDKIQQDQIDAIRGALTEAQRPAYDAWRAERQKTQQKNVKNRKNVASSVAASSSN